MKKVDALKKLDKYETKEVSIYDIELGERYRKTYSDIDRLKYSFREQGILQPFAVIPQEGKAKPYIIAFGGRRFKAALEMAEAKEISPLITVRVLPKDISQLDRLIVELWENLFQQKPAPMEEIEIKKRIYDTWIAKYGQRIASAKEGTSLRDIADVIGESHANLHRDITLAKQLKSLPAEVKTQLSQLETKSEIRQTLASLDKAVRREMKAEDYIREEKPIEISNMINAYKIGNASSLIRQLSNESIDFIELDPPFAIDINNTKQHVNQSLSNAFTEVDAKTYPLFLSVILKECFRVIKPNSWAILWFAPEPWYTITLKTIRDVGFTCNGRPALWYKRGAAHQSRNRTVNFGSAYEMFFYFRKGNAELREKGYSNVFECGTVTAIDKVHLTEKPKALYDILIPAFTDVGCKILSPFAGSGNVLVSAFCSNRTAEGYDVNEENKAGYIARLKTAFNL